jgi:integrase
MPSVLKRDGPRPYWYIRYRRKVLAGKNEIRREEKWHRLGYCDEMTKREALRRREEIMQMINREVYTIRSQVRFGDVAEMYREHHIPTLAPGGKSKQLSLLKNHVLPAFGEMRICDVGTQEIQAFLNSKMSDGLSWWTRHDLRGVISNVFSKATDWGYWNERNPAQRVRLGRKNRKWPKRILTDEQIRSLLWELEPQASLMVLTAVSTGMRISEILALKWRSADLDRGLIFVEERRYRGDTDVPKSERSRRVLPLGRLDAALRKHRPLTWKLDDYVFQRNGEPLDDRDLLRQQIRPAAERLGFYFTGFGWHSFRRQNLTLIQEEGATAIEAQAQAGHSRPVMTSEYTVVGLDRREAAVRRVQERLFGGLLDEEERPLQMRA